MSVSLYIRWIGEDGRLLREFGPFLDEHGLELRLGRSESSDLPLDDKSVSRLHGVLRCEHEVWTYEDLGSSYGSELEGEALSAPTTLLPGQRLRLGRVLLKAALEPFKEVPSATDERPYSVLLQVLETLGGDRSLDEILGQVIAIAGRAVEADRGFILLTDSETGRWMPESLAVWSREGEENFAEDAIGRASQTVLRDALASGRTVFLKFAAEDPVYQGAESIRVESIQTVICCPLLMGEDRVGAFYVDRTHGGGRPFSDEDRGLLETVAAQAARGIEKERLMAERARSEKLALLGTLLGRVTHELKNPLYNIRGTAENLQAKISSGGLPAEEVASRLDRILAGVDRAEANMKTLLAFASPSEGPREPVDLARALTAAAVDAADLFRERGLKLERDYGKGLRVLGRADGLQQLFANLLVNAAQAIEDGGKVRLALSTLSRLGAEEDNWVEVSVEDEGPGIPPENLTRIFEDFFTTKRGSGGSGLGLAICRQIAEEHRGSIRAENREGGGARFVVGLPIHDRQSRSRND